jgi:hypothetical protein
MAARVDFGVEDAGEPHDQQADDDKEKEASAQVPDE